MNDPKTYISQSTANNKDTSRTSTSTVVKTTNNITSDELGTDGIDIEDIVTVNKIVNSEL